MDKEETIEEPVKDPWDEFSDDIDKQKLDKPPVVKLSDAVKADKKEDSPFDIVDGKKVFDPAKDDDDLKDDVKDDPKQLSIGALRKARDEARKEAADLKAEVEKLKAKYTLPDADQDYFAEKTAAEVVAENKALKAQIAEKAKLAEEAQGKLKELNIEFDPVYVEQYEKPLLLASERIDTLISDVDANGAVRNAADFAALRNTLFNFKDGKPASNGKEVKAILLQFKKQYELKHEETYVMPEPMEVLQSMQLAIQAFEKRNQARKDWTAESSSAKERMQAEALAAEEKRAKANKKERIGQFNKLINEIDYEDYDIIGSKGEVRNALAVAAKSLDQIIEGEVTPPSFSDAVLMNFKARQYDLLIKKLQDNGLVDDDFVGIHNRVGDQNHGRDDQQKKKDVDWTGGLF